MTNGKMDRRISSCHAEWRQARQQSISDEGANMIFAGLRQEEFHETERIC